MNGLLVVVERGGRDEMVLGARDYHTEHSAYEAFILTPGAAPISDDVITVRLSQAGNRVIEKPVSPATAAAILELPERIFMRMVRTRRRFANVGG